MIDKELNLGSIKIPLSGVTKTFAILAKRGAGKSYAEKSGLTYTRSQIALATGYSANGGSFINALSLLRRNLLIKEENGRICINPDL